MCAANLCGYHLPSTSQEMGRRCPARVQGSGGKRTGLAVHDSSDAAFSRKIIARRVEEDVNSGRMAVSVTACLFPSDGDIPASHEVAIERSVRELQAADYSPAQMDGALGSVFGVDRQLIRDQDLLRCRTGWSDHRVRRMEQTRVAFRKRCRACHGRCPARSAPGRRPHSRLLCSSGARAPRSRSCDSFRVRRGDSRRAVSLDRIGRDSARRALLSGVRL